MDENDCPLIQIQPHTSFVLNEDIFIKFEEDFINYGLDERTKIMKEFEHIHNKVIPPAEPSPPDPFPPTLTPFRLYLTVSMSPSINSSPTFSKAAVLLHGLTLITI